MSEEWEALLFIQTQEQINTGRRPSVNEAIGKSIINNAKELGYQDEQRQSIK
jgi:ribosomal protein L15E